jgi:hypothetical protein
LFFVFPVFCEQRIESIFNHVLCSGMIEYLHDFGPFFTMVSDVQKDFVVFFVGPFTFVFVGIEMVEPSLPAMFRGLENEAIRVKEESFGDLVPLSNALVNGSFR